MVNIGFQNIERQRTLIENGVVEGADVELGAEFLPGSFAKAQDGHLAEFVAQRLRGPGDIAVYFRFDILVVHGAVLVKEIDHLLARPMLGMDAGIDNQAD